MSWEPGSRDGVVTGVATVVDRFGKVVGDGGEIWTRVARDLLRKGILFSVGNFKDMKSVSFNDGPDVRDVMIFAGDRPVTDGPYEVDHGWIDHSHKDREFMAVILIKTVEVGGERLPFGRLNIHYESRRLFSGYSTTIDFRRLGGEYVLEFFGAMGGRAPVDLKVRGRVDEIKTESGLVGILEELAEVVPEKQAVEFLMGPLGRIVSDLSRDDAQKLKGMGR